MTTFRAAYCIIRINFLFLQLGFHKKKNPLEEKNHYPHLWLRTNNNANLPFSYSFTVTDVVAKYLLQEDTNLQSSQSLLRF